jgi:hypothetical protein
MSVAQVGGPPKGWSAAWPPVLIAEARMPVDFQALTHLGTNPKTAVFFWIARGLQWKPAYVTGYSPQRRSPQRRSPQRTLARLATSPSSLSLEALGASRGGSNRVSRCWGERASSPPAGLRAQQRDLAYRLRKALLIALAFLRVYRTYGCGCRDGDFFSKRA